MKHAVSQELFQYWSKLRGERNAPDRSDLDPAMIRGILADTFVLEVAPRVGTQDRSFSIRLSGTRVNALFLDELKQRCFLSVWDPDERPAVEDILNSVLDDQIAMVADLENPLYPTLVGPLHDRFAEHGYRMVLLAERGDDQVTYARLLDKSVDAAVLTTSLLDSSLSQLLIDRELPFVELNRRSGLAGARSLTADNIRGAQSCGELLAGR